MPTIPSLVIQSLQAGATFSDVPPGLGGLPFKVVGDVHRQLRGRVWRYKVGDQGGRFLQPEDLARLEAMERLAGARIEDLMKIPSSLRGASLQRVFHRGQGVTGVTISVVDPVAEISDVAGEVLSLTPAPDGIRQVFEFSLANSPVVTENLTFTIGDERFVEVGDGLVKGDKGGKGVVFYDVGFVRLIAGAPPAPGAPASADYSYGSGSAIYTVFTDATLGVDPQSFIADVGGQGGLATNLVLPPQSYVTISTTGAPTGVSVAGVYFGPGWLYSVGQPVAPFGV